MSTGCAATTYEGKRSIWRRIKIWWTCSGPQYFVSLTYPTLLAGGISLFISPLISIVFLLCAIFTFIKIRNEYC